MRSSARVRHWSAGDSIIPMKTSSVPHPQQPVRTCSRITLHAGLEGHAARTSRSPYPGCRTCGGMGPTAATNSSSPWTGHCLQARLVLRATNTGLGTAPHSIEYTTPTDQWIRSRDASSQACWSLHCKNSHPTWKGTRDRHHPLVRLLRDC
ncbi:hypothetical protein VTK56DRAFT_5993 [Thermocarpiscus australiensis]